MGLLDGSITVAPVVVKPDIDSNQEYSAPCEICLIDASPEYKSKGP